MRRVLILGLLLVSGALSGCDTDSTVIAVLASDRDAQVLQPLDVGGLQARVDEICDGCTVKVFDAGTDADDQSSQFDKALDTADVVILDPVDPEHAESLVKRAGEVPVIAFGTLVPGADSFVGMAEAPSPMEGVDTDLEAAREVILRKRPSFSFVPAAAMSVKVAEVAVGELVDVPVADSVEHEGVPSWLFESADVTINDLTSVAVASGAMTLADLCAGATATRCAKIGLV